MIREIQIYDTSIRFVLVFCILGIANYTLNFRFADLGLILDAANNQIGFVFLSGMSLFIIYQTGKSLLERNETISPTPPAESPPKPLPLFRTPELELVHVVTEDHLRLDGILHHADATTQNLNVDVVICIHGNGDDFHRPSIFDQLSSYLSEKGIDTLRIDTRGRGTVSNLTTPYGNKKYGSAYEILSDSYYDLTTWIYYLKCRGYERIGLAGHSLGAIKAFYYTYATMQDLSFIIALSPPRLSHSVIADAGIGEEFKRTIASAQRLAESGRAKDLMQVKVPMRYLTSAKSYLDKYSEHEFYRIERLVASTSTPILVTIGSLEQNSPLFSNLIHDLKNLRLDNLSISSIEGGNHYYTGVRESTIFAIDDFLERLDSYSLHQKEQLISA